MMCSYVIGGAHDEAALRALNDWLTSQRARLAESSYSAEGDVETLRWVLTVDGQAVTVFADTEAGLSVCGEGGPLLQAAAFVIKKRAAVINKRDARPALAAS